MVPGSAVFLLVLLLSSCLFSQAQTPVPTASTAQAQASPSPQPTPHPSPSPMPKRFTPEAPFEVGAIISGVTGTGLGNDFGVGGRITYFYEEDAGGEADALSAVEAEIQYMPVDKAPDVFHGGHALEMLAGGTFVVGDRNENLGARLRGGFVRSSNAVTQLTTGPTGTQVATRFGAITTPVLEFGLLMEYFGPNRKSSWGWRADIGDLVLFYPDVPARGFEVRHHFQASMALVYRFPKKK